MYSKIRIVRNWVWAWSVWLTTLNSTFARHVELRVVTKLASVLAKQYDKTKLKSRNFLGCNDEDEEDEHRSDSI